MSRVRPSLASLSAGLAAGDAAFFLSGAAAVLVRLEVAESDADLTLLAGAESGAAFAPLGVAGSGATLALVALVALVALLAPLAPPAPTASAAPAAGPPRETRRLGSALTSSVAEGNRRSDKVMGCFASTISAVKDVAANQRAGSRAAQASRNHSRPAPASAQFRPNSLPVVRMFTLSDFDFD